MSKKTLHYGYCMAISGALKGQVVYYDDHDERLAIVYTGAFLDGYHRVAPKSLRQATHEEVAEHILAGHALWADARRRIFKEIIVLDHQTGEKEPRDENAPPGDIAADTEAAFDAVRSASNDKERRLALLRLALLSTVWIQVMEQNSGEPTPETREAQAKARRNLGGSKPSAPRAQADA